MTSVFYAVPTDFQEQLERQSRGRLRIRWSPLREEWHIEQKVGAAAAPPYRLNPYDDSLIRARDGYWFVMAVRPGDRMPCPTCGLAVKIKTFVCEESTCQNCKSKGRDGRVKGVYFPLGEALLEHLRKIDPENGGIQRLKAEVDSANAQMLATKQRASMNRVEDATKDQFTKLFEIQSVGYTGKDFK